ncbi:MAG: hypothetical protein ABJA82_18315 [Myxococcales bacterium]
MTKLLNAVRLVAREEDELADACPDDQVPVVSPAVRADITRELWGAISRTRGGAAAGPALDDGDPWDRVGARRAEEARRQTRRRMAWSMATVGVAAAAALVMWIRQSPAPVTDDGATGLPDYAIAASGGVAETRGPAPATGMDEAATATTTTAPVRLSPSSELRVTCRPDTAVPGPLAVRAFLVRDGAAREVFPQIQVATSGAVDLRLPGAQLHGGPATVTAAGEAGRPTGELLVVVGRPQAVHDVGPGDVLKGASGRFRPGAAGDAVQRDQRWLAVPLAVRPSWPD